MTLRLIIFYIASFVSTVNLCGQSGVVVTGQSIENGSGKISASIGQSDYKNTTTITGSVNAGIQQSNTVAVEIVELDSLIIDVYPNPTQDVVYIDLMPLLRPIHITVVSADGKTLVTDTFLNDIHSSISLANLATGIYYLQLFQGQVSKRTYKIIKQ